MLSSAHSDHRASPRRASPRSEAKPGVPFPKLARLGYRVLRLEAGLVMRELPAALGRVREALAQ
jgi:hypothetical protein